MVKRSSEEKSAESSSSNLKLISTTSGIRVSQACDRCRIKKIKCDGRTPCHNCSKSGFDCKTSDKLTRRAFPKGYTENLENRVKELEDELKHYKDNYGVSEAGAVAHTETQASKEITFNGAVLRANEVKHETPSSNGYTNANIPSVESNSATKQVIINNPIDQIFNLDRKGVIIGNDNLNFESQFNHLLINLNLPFLKISNSHNYLLNDPDSYLYHPAYTAYNQFHNKDLDVIYNPLTSNNASHDDYTQGVSSLTNSELPKDIYDLFIKLINNFKKIFNNKKELDNQITQFFLNYNVFIPIFDYKQFMESYDNFHTMYPFMFTYDDATINGFNIANNDYHVVNEYLMVVIQIYAMIMMNNPTINLNLLLNHPSPHYVFEAKNDPKSKNIIRSLYDFLPYFNVFHVSINQLQTYLLFLYFSLLTNNKEKSLVLSALINAFIGILGINLNAKNLFFNDLSLSYAQKASRVKIFWVFKVLLKCFNLKFGFKPSLNTTVINPVTIDRYFELTPEKLSALLDDPNMAENSDHHVNDLFKTLLKPSVEFLNLVNIIIPSSFSPNYYQYLKNDHHQDNQTSKRHPKNLDWILNDDDGDGNDGNLNYNLTQFVTIDKNLSNWRASLKEKKIRLAPLQYKMNLPAFASSPAEEMNLFHSIRLSKLSDLDAFGISPQGMNNFLNNGVPDPETACLLIKIQLNFHYLLIRSMNYLNFIIDKELSNNYYVKINNISKELLCYFILIFRHVALSYEVRGNEAHSPKNGFLHHNPHSTGTNPAIMDALGLDVDEDGFVINDFSARRRRTSSHALNNPLLKVKQFPASPFNFMLNGLSMTIINFKKSLLMQMLYLLICSIKFFKKTHTIEIDVVEIIIASVDLFIKVFINYELNSSSRKVGHTSNKMNKMKQDELFKKLMNDELRDQILREPRNEEDDYVDVELEQNYFTEFNELSDIDWDDEDMDEDFKYLKILKFIKYKIIQLKEISKRKALTKSSAQTDAAVSGGTSDRVAKSRAPTLSADKATPGYYSAPKQAESNVSIPSLPKIPLTTKLDFLLQGDSLPSHTLTTPALTRNNAKFGDSTKSENLIKKERLVINDLMSLKHGHASPTNTYMNQSWAFHNNDSPS